MSKHMYQIKAMLDHSMSSGFWMDGEEIPYDDLIKYLDRLKQERERWKAAVDDLLAEYKPGVLPPPSDEELADLDAGGCICDLDGVRVQVLDKLLAKMERADD